MIRIVTRVLIVGSIATFCVLAFVAAMFLAWLAGGA